MEIVKVKFEQGLQSCVISQNQARSRYLIFGIIWVYKSTRTLIKHKNLLVAL